MAGAELCWNKEKRWHIRHSGRLENLPDSTYTERLLRGQKRRERCTISVVKPPTSLYTRIHLGKMMHIHIGKGPRASQVWKRKKIIG